MNAVIQHFARGLARLTIAGALVFSGAITPVLSAQTVRAAALKCEYRSNPLGIDVAQPRLSWMLQAPAPGSRGIRQTAYRVVVASTAENLAASKGDLWDTGKIDSDQSIQVPYAGKPVPSGAKAFWKVQVWDQNGKPSAWSQVAFWSMGLSPENWKAKWIGRDEPGLYHNPSSPFQNLRNAKWIWAPDRPSGKRWFRATLNLPEGRVTRGTAVIVADQSYELTLNGRKIGKGAMFRWPDTYAVTEYLKPGPNRVEVAAASQKSDTAGLLAAIKVEYEKGEPVLFTTGPDWQSSDGTQWEAAKVLGPYGMQPWGETGFVEERALPARMLRKEFDAKPAIRRATAYVSGLGLFEMYLNGTKVGDHVLSPGLTEYDKRVQYLTFDVTKLMAAGRNAVGLWLGNGRYHGPRDYVPIRSRTYGDPKAIAQIEIEYEDGATARVITDETWKLTTRGPIRANNEYDGEEYDATVEMPGWARAGFDESAWEPAQLVKPPAGTLVAQMAEPLRVTETLKPVQITQPSPGVYIFDMGQNMVGWCRLHVKGPKGTQVELHHAETLKPDGTLYVDNLRSARAADTYTLKGGVPEVWEPRFTYHGFRFVEVRGYPGEPSLASLEGRVVHDAMDKTADFATSNSLLNRLHKNIYWGVRGNYRSIPTDCPQRDERQGWLGDRSVVSRSESYLFDVAAFYSKWMSDLVDSQNAAGAIPDVAPAFWAIYSENITWPSAFINIPVMLQQQYADTRVIERDYPAMKRWVEHMQQRFLKDDLMTKDTYGDWCVPPESPELIHSNDPARRTNGVLISTVYYHEMLRIMARFAAMLGKNEDAAQYSALAARVKDAFLKRFFKPDLNQFDNGTQTSSVLPLAFGLVPEANRKAVFDRLVAKIEKESDSHVGVGLVGAQWLMRTLSDNGRPDLAFRVATQTTYPGWGYMISQGATTIWELWNGNTADPAMNSGNHVMQIGDLGVWMYEYLAGIRTDPEQPGFKRTVIKPFTVDGLNFVKASHKSMYGDVRSYWHREPARLALDVTIPPNTSAVVYVPVKGAERVVESGVPAEKARGVKFLRREDGAAVYAVESGTYSFQALK